MSDAALSAAPPRARRRHAGAVAEAMAGWSLALPATILMILLLLGPALGAVILALTDWQFGAPTLNWIGLGNFVDMAGDRVFWRSLGNTMIYIGLVVPLSVLLGLGAALLIEADPAGRSFYRAAFFLPVASTLLAMAIVWEFLLHPSFGLVNRVVELFGASGIDWLKNPATALPTVAAIGIWKALGLNMVLFMAGLKSIPHDLYDAAAIDGADGAWERFRRVTWPMLGPTLMFVLVISAIRAFQESFDLVAVLTQGGPNKATEVLLYTIYQEGFSFFRSGYAAALTLIFLAFVLALTLLQAKVLDKRVHYG
ncbi:MAG: sugar ABC transporter permease [Ferrovibrio sp.]|uniref:carbohydrate ABC transporter permease n=1 Tax=Ferrovibrio sp. TaxID=1917215 RepID=UPI0026319012|nr:sugar ABC transporter permease [Ferrovibrio sp.]MCW0233899.1 sugar ABC transporter permease [Ferrovibrio sp.]